MLNDHFVVVLFQTVYQGKPAVFFYKLVSLGLDESASGLYNAITDEFQKEPHDFAKYMRENLVGYVSDPE